VTGQRLPRLRPRTRRRLTAGALAAVALAGLSGALLGSRVPAASPTAARHGARGTRTGDARSTAGTSGTAQAPPLGVYVGSGAAAAEAVDGQLAGRIPYVLDFLPRTSWTTLTSPTWLAQRWHGSPFDLVVGLPMLPNNGGTLAQGASGVFDPEFRSLAERLVHDGLGNTILMVGYQPDDTGTPWYVGTEAAATEYVRFWEAIQSTMSRVPGAHFLFEWDAGDAGTSPLSPAVMYPGNRSVSIVATDAFDFVGADPKTTGHWSTVLGERYGPAWMESFALAHHKPMAIAMWGEVPSSEGGAGDDAAYVSQLLRWAGSEQLVMCVLWDYQAAALTGGGFPQADAALRQALVPVPGTKRRAGRQHGR
jgi:hypothetical protein